MKRLLLLACLVLCAAPASAIEKRYSGACGGDVTDMYGDRTECSCDERPYCDDTDDGGEFCYCERDQYCADAACGSSVARASLFLGTVAGQRAQSRLPGRVGGE
jgi:hypothetical protein